MLYMYFNQKDKYSTRFTQLYTIVATMRKAFLRGIHLMKCFMKSEMFTINDPRAACRSQVRMQLSSPNFHLFSAWRHNEIY